MLDLDGSVYDEYRAGFDQSEVFEIRPYRPGDKTAQIHWKLSQKTDTLMLRQGSLPVKNALLLILEAPQGKENSESAADLSERAQRAAARLFSLSESLAEKGVQHHIGYLASDASDSFLAALPWHFRRRAISTGERAVGVFPCAYHQR